MLQKRNLQLNAINRSTLVIHMLVGAVIALTFISMFLISAGKGDPEWPALWFIRPLIFVPVAGAIGGGFHYYMHHLKPENAGMKVIAIIIAFLGYLISVWLGSVLGLDGTWWN